MPPIKASLGAPKGVDMTSSSVFVKPSISYNPLPPMMPIVGSLMMCQTGKAAPRWQSRFFSEIATLRKYATFFATCAQHQNFS
jgi:hypothetical protein